MNKKQLVNCWIDLETYVAIKSQQLNMSELIRGALRAAVNTQLTGDEVLLTEEVKKDRELISEATKRLGENSVKLAAMQQRREQEAKVQAQEDADKMKSLIKARVHNF